LRHSADEQNVSVLCNKAPLPRGYLLATVSEQNVSRGYGRYVSDP